MTAHGTQWPFSGVPSDFRCRPENRPSCPNVPVFGRLLPLHLGERRFAYPISEHEELQDPSTNAKLIWRLVRVVLK